MMEDSPSSSQRGSASDAGNVDGTVVDFEDLPEGHLVRLAFRSYADWPPATPVDWNAVMQRLESSVGALEARQCVRMPCGDTRRFLRVICAYSPDPSILPQAELREDAELGFRVALKAIEVYPEAVGLPSSSGDYPIHSLCGKPCFHRYYNGTAETLFRKVLFGCPEAVRAHSGGFTALHAFTSGFASIGSGDYSAVHLLELLLDLFPDAVRIRDAENGCLPLQYALHGGKFDVRAIKTILDAYPRAVQLTEPSNLSCIQIHLSSHMYVLNPGDYDVTRLLIEASPWMVAHDDGEVLRKMSYDDSFLLPTGDTLDYLCVIYCYVSRVFWMENVDDSEDENDDDDSYDEDPEYRRYLHSNVAFLEGRRRHGSRSEQLVEATLEMLVTILQTMYGRLDQNLPLHAAVHGSLCRPWHLVAMHAIVSRFRPEVDEVDSHGDLPLHLFLKSCMIERDRAIARGYVNDVQEYEMAIHKCFRMLLEANPRTAAMPDGDGRLPLHLTLCHRSLSFNTLVSPLLELEPRALLTRDITTRLYPFANAAIGANGNVDATYQLLRRDPSLLNRLDYSAGHCDSLETRKRKRA